MEAPSEKPISIPGMGSKETPGGRKTQTSRSEERSFGFGCLTKFGAGTFPFAHCREDFTWLPMSSPTDAPLMKKGIEDKDAIARKTPKIWSPSVFHNCISQVGMRNFCGRKNKRAITNGDTRRKSIFSLEYRFSHSGCLLLRRADSMTKKSNHQAGSVRNSLRILKALSFASLIFPQVRTFHSFPVTDRPLAKSLPTRIHILRMSDHFSLRAPHPGNDGVLRAKVHSWQYLA